MRHWVHGEHLLFEGRKMAKSTGNVVLVDDVAARHDPLALRLAFLQFRYRQQANLSWEGIAAADKLLTSWRFLVARWAESDSKPMCADYQEQVTSAFDDDLDTPRALQVLRRAAADESVPPGSRFELFAWADRVLALDLVKDVGRPAVMAVLPPGAEQLLAARATARTERDFASSDRLRDELAALGVAVTDTAAGQEWSLG